ncbi:MAG: hypothetical protein H0X01_05635 [Nitrospira sp.]|nr:hypothetical protein [Nitrospira sp.]
MSLQGKTQLTIIFTCPPNLLAEGDRIFASHARWMRNMHHREGEKALLQYTVAKGPELTEPTDPSSKPTGNTSFILKEFYETPAGLADHWKQSSSWEDFPALMAWASKCKVTTAHGAPVVHSLW